MGQGAATTITPQDERTPTGIPTCAQPPTIVPVTLRPEAQWK